MSLKSLVSNKYQEIQSANEMSVSANIQQKRYDFIFHGNAALQHGFIELFDCNKGVKFTVATNREMLPLWCSGMTQIARFIWYGRST